MQETRSAASELTFDGGKGRAIPLSNDGEEGLVSDTLASSSHDGSVKVWDLVGRCCGQTIIDHGGTCYATVSLKGRRGKDGKGGGD